MWEPIALTTTTCSLPELLCWSTISCAASAIRVAVAKQVPPNLCTCDAANSSRAFELVSSCWKGDWRSKLFQTDLPVLATRKSVRRGLCDRVCEGSLQLDAMLPTSVVEEFFLAEKADAALLVALLRFYIPNTVLQTPWHHVCDGERLGTRRKP